MSWSSFWQKRTVAELLGYRIGPWNLPLPDEPLGALFVGNIGSGKSTLINMALDDNIIPRIGSLYYPNHRAFIYSIKWGMFSYVSLLAERAAQRQHRAPAPVILFDPFDTRTCSWGVGRDVQDITDARGIAEILIPEAKADNPIWHQTPRHGSTRE